MNSTGEVGVAGWGNIGSDISNPRGKVVSAKTHQRLEIGSEVGVAVQQCRQQVGVVMVIRGWK